MKRFFALLLAVLIPVVAFADPLPLVDDLTETISVLYDESDPSAGRYEYTYRYPYADPEDPTAYLVNTFFEYLIRDTKVYTVPNLSEYYAGLWLSVSVDISYEVMCNNDEYFSVRIHTLQEEEGENPVEMWDAYTFSRINGMPGNTYSLPQVLGILDAGESDDWYEERQVGKARDVGCALVWDLIVRNPNDIPYYEDLAEEDLDTIFDPELDFWLDDAGNPVFFIVPGQAADFDAGLLVFPLTLEEIDDEL